MSNVFRQRVLLPLPSGAEVIFVAQKRVARFVENGRTVQRQIVKTRLGDKIVVGQSPHWYGKIRVAPKTWRRERLYSDKVASERRLAELQREADQRHAGVRTPDTDKIALPITALRDEYIAALRRERKKPAHVRITEFMLNRLIEKGEWQLFRDITRENVQRIVDGVIAEGRTVSYANKFIARAKAFVRHWLPDGWPDPLAKLKRISLKGAKSTRARRAATPAQVAGLLRSAIPPQRRLAYALAALNGLRRNEVKDLTWGRLHLSAPIPYLAVPNKQRTNDVPDFIPLHPHVLKILHDEWIVAMPTVQVLPSVPDVATLQKDWDRIGVTMTDERGLRLDYHALRHTFQTHLDQAGCSRATKKKLMRHAAQDVTDGYAHAELAEMAAALQRLPVLAADALAAVATGTDGKIAQKTPDHRQDHGTGVQRSSLVSSGGMDHHGARGALGEASPAIRAAFGVSGDKRGCGESSDLIETRAADTVEKTGPDTQVD